MPLAATSTQQLWFLNTLHTVRVRHDGEAVASRQEHLDASVGRFAGKHIRSPVQRRVMPPVHRAVQAWGGRLDRLLRH